MDEAAQCLDDLGRLGDGALDALHPGDGLPDGVSAGLGGLVASAVGLFGGFGVFGDAADGLGELLDQFGAFADGGGLGGAAVGDFAGAPRGLLGGLGDFLHGRGDLFGRRPDLLGRAGQSAGRARPPAPTELQLHGPARSGGLRVAEGADGGLHPGQHGVERLRQLSQFVLGVEMSSGSELV